MSNHDELMSNFFAQPDALALGKTAEELKAHWTHLDTSGQRIQHDATSRHRKMRFDMEDMVYEGEGRNIQIEKNIESYEYLKATMTSRLIHAESFCFRSPFSDSKSQP